MLIVIGLESWIGVATGLGFWIGFEAAFGPRFWAATETEVGLEA